MSNYDECKKKQFLVFFYGGFFFEFAFDLFFFFRSNKVVFFRRPVYVCVWVIILCYLFLMKNKAYTHWILKIRLGCCIPIPHRNTHITVLHNYFSYLNVENNLLIDWLIGFTQPKTNYFVIIQVKYRKIPSFVVCAHEL